MLEPGPGTGVLTAALADRAGRVEAIELDRWLVNRLQQRFSDHAGVTIKHGNFLTARLPARPYTFVSNVPFGQTADFVRKALLSKSPPQDAYMILEASASARFLGQPFEDESVLSLMIGARFERAILEFISPTHFEPMPKANSVLVRFKKRDPSFAAPADLHAFDRFAGKVFNTGGQFNRSSLLKLCPRNLASPLVNELGSPQGRPASAIGFEHWWTLYRLNRERK